MWFDNDYFILSSEKTYNYLMHIILSMFEIVKILVRNYIKYTLYTF